MKPTLRGPRALTLALTAVLLVPLALQAQTTPPAPVQPPPTPTTPPPSLPMATPGAKPQRMAADKFAHLDSNHDGAITRDEAGAAPQLSSRFDEVDADRDGRLTPAELKAYAKTHRKDPSEKAGKAGKAGKVGMTGGFDQMDTNHDGVVTRDEIAANPKMAKRFDAADANHDGRVTPEEYQAFRGQ